MRSWKAVGVDQANISRLNICSGRVVDRREGMVLHRLVDLPNSVRPWPSVHKSEGNFSMVDIVNQPGRLRPAPENFLSEEQIKAVGSRAA
jgi:hypothetical protein